MKVVCSTAMPSAGGPESSTHPAAPARPGWRLLAAVAVMDRLRAPGGCPWDAEQTPASLLRYLVEECYELVDAVERGNAEAVREELGDVLLQVLFHARIAAEAPAGAGGFDIDDVAGDLVDKLVRRHPHVFGAGRAEPALSSGPSPEVPPVPSAADQQDRWDELKKSERGRAGALDGVALGQPAAALAGKLGQRAGKNGLDVDPPTGDSVGEQLFRIAYAAGARGDDPESELRAVARRHAEDLRVAERARERRGDR